MKLTDRKNSSLGAQASDLIHIVKTGDTSQSSAGSSYKIEMGDYKTLFSFTGGTITGNTVFNGGITANSVTTNIVSATTVNSTTVNSTNVNTTNLTSTNITTQNLVANSLTATTISATTYLGLPKDIYVSGGTYSNGTATFTNNSGGTFNVTGFKWTSGTGPNSIVSVGSSSTSSGQNSVAEGFGTQATGDFSHAEGQASIASGNYSHAEGGSTSATSAGAHSEGFQTLAQGGSSHAEGRVTRATGFASHAQGESTLASATYSHAGGYLSEANGQASFVHGAQSQVNGNYSIVLGRGITGNQPDTTYVDNLNIKTLGSGTPVASLGVDSNGNVVSGSTGGSGIPSYKVLLISSWARDNQTTINTGLPVGSTILSITPQVMCTTAVSSFQVGDVMSVNSNEPNDNGGTPGHGIGIQFKPGVSSSFYLNVEDRVYIPSPFLSNGSVGDSFEVVTPSQWSLRFVILYI